jgi:hypothetical protein
VKFRSTTNTPTTEPSCADIPLHEHFPYGLCNASRAHAEALTARWAGKEIVSDYTSDSNPASVYCSDSSYEFDFGSDPDEPESENSTTEQPLSGPSTDLVITSTPAGRFIYWPDRKPADLVGGNSRCVAYLDSLPFQEGTPLAPREEHTPTEVATTDSGLGTPDRQVFMATGETPGPSGTRPTGTLKISQQTSCLQMHPLMKPTTTRTLDESATGSGTNNVDISVKPSPYGISQRPLTKSKTGCTQPSNSASCLELGLGPCRAGPARPSRASCRVVPRLLGTLGTSCRAMPARQDFYLAQAWPVARRHGFVPCRHKHGPHNIAKF